MKKLIFFLCLIGLLFSQNNEVVEPVLLDDNVLVEDCEPCEVCPEPCDGQCLPDDVVQTLRESILTLENDKVTNEKIIENLNSQIYMYIQTTENDSLMIEDYKKKLELKEEMINLVKPKWYENKWIWFGLGVAFTSGSVHLAGQIGN